MYRYDFHRGVDIPIPIGTPLVAIDDGTVRIAGSHPAYSDEVVQVLFNVYIENYGTTKLSSCYAKAYSEMVLCNHFGAKVPLKPYEESS